MLKMMMEELVRLTCEMEVAVEDMRRYKCEKWINEQVLENKINNIDLLELKVESLKEDIEEQRKIN